MAIFKLPQRISFGEEIGTGVGLGLQALLKDKMDKMLKQREVDSNESLLKQANYPKDIIQKAKYASPKQIEILLKSPANAEYEEELRKAAGLSPEAQRVDQTQNFMQPGQVPQAAQQGVAQQEVGRTPEAEGIDALKQLLSGPQEAAQQEVGQDPIIDPSRGSEALQPRQAPISRSRTPRQAEKLAELRLKREAIKERTIASKYKVSQKYNDRVNKRAENARSDLVNIREQERLIDSGKLIGPKQRVFLGVMGRAFGLDEESISSFTGSASQIFEKLNIPFFRGLKDRFGARPTQWDAEQFKKGFASFYQTDTGKRVILSFMKHEKKSDIMVKRVRDQIIKEYGAPPYDIESQVAQRIESWQDKKYLKLRKKTSEILALEHGPKMSAKEAGKGNAIEKNGVEFISDGNKWKVLWSDAEEGV